LASQCQSGYRNCGYCVPGNAYCGGVANPMYFSNGSTASNQWLDGRCNNGTWQTAANGYGCANIPSFVCGYFSYACVNGYTCDTNQNNGQGGNGKCVANCTPSCSGKNCGDNGCGGTCGTCASGQTCSNGVCTNNLLANGSICSAASKCQSGYCNCGYCVPGSTYCGGGTSPLYWASGSSSTNQWLTGYCNNGTWQVAANGYGCNITPSTACGYSSFACVSGYRCDTNQNNGQGGNGKCVANSTVKVNGEQCASNADCITGVCSYTYCVPAGNWCGGVVNPMYFSNGSTASNQWLNGVCRNGVWKTVLNGIGCNSFACDSGTCVSNKCVSSSSAIPSSLYMASLSRIISQMQSALAELANKIGQ
jgi:hypothetical protein